MGVTIHFNGRLNDINRLSPLVKEMKDISSVLEWPYREMDEDWNRKCEATIIKGNIEGHLGLKGLSLKPHPDSEYFTLLFNKEGYLLTEIGAALVLSGEMEIEKSWNSIKTQFAPADIHMRIIGILKYLKRKYLANLLVHDEGEYWETGDLERLNHHRGIINQAMDILEDTLASSDVKAPKHPSAEEVADEIERLIDNKESYHGFLKEVERYANPAPVDKTPIKSLFPETVAFPPADELDDIVLENKLDEILGVLDDNNIRVEPPSDISDRRLYQYIIEEVIPAEDVLPADGSGASLVFTGCDGGCEDCFQKDWCDIYEKSGKEDEES